MRRFSLESRSKISPSLLRHDPTFAFSNSLSPYFPFRFSTFFFICYLSLSIFFSRSFSFLYLHFDFIRLLLLSKKSHFTFAYIFLSTIHHFFRKTVLLSLLLIWIHKTCHCLPVGPLVLLTALLEWMLPTQMPVKCRTALVSLGCPMQLGSWLWWFTGRWPTTVELGIQSSPVAQGRGNILSQPLDIPWIISMIQWLLNTFFLYALVLKCILRNNSGLVFIFMSVVVTTGMPILPVRTRFTWS